jgi:hypothetical protein
MLVSMPRRRGFGDAVDDILAGNDSDGLVTKPPVLSDSLITPTWASSTSSAPPVTPTQGNNSSSWSWGDLAKNLVAGTIQGITKPIAPKPTTILGSSSGSTLPLLIGGAAAVGLVVLLLRRREA